MRPLYRDGPRLALVLVWIGTAVASLWDGGKAGQALLHASGIGEPWALGLVWSGALWDFAVGVALALWPRRGVYLLAVVGMLLMTLLATFLKPDLWLDPLGPLLKNLAVLALLMQGLHRRTPR